MFSLDVTFACVLGEESKLVRYVNERRRSLFLLQNLALQACKPCSTLHGGSNDILLLSRSTKGKDLCMAGCL